MNIFDTNISYIKVSAPTLLYIIIIIIIIIPYLWKASKVLWTKKLRSLKCYRCIPHRYRGCANSLQQTRKNKWKCISCRWKSLNKINVKSIYPLYTYSLIHPFLSVSRAALTHKHNPWKTNHHRHRYIINTSFFARKNYDVGLKLYIHT
jgi:hypothetical protein